MMEGHETDRVVVVDRVLKDLIRMGLVEEVPIARTVPKKGYGKGSVHKAVRNPAKTKRARG